MRIARTKEEMRELSASIRAAGKRLAFVPTMGALHEGHLSLVKTGLEHADVCAASIFVNPTQFAPGEDFATYPRDEAGDLKRLEDAGCTLVYCPGVEDMYPPGDLTRVIVKELSYVLEGEFRPHFFEGVATVVSRLFLHVAPDVAVFGEKDFQQLQILKRMTRDLGFPVDVIGAPTVREADGLAMSSRNAYLAPEQRKLANAMYRALTLAAETASKGGSIAAAEVAGRDVLLEAGFDSVDYVAVRDAETLAAFADDLLPRQVSGRVLAAARLGKTRLIDNIAVTRAE
ncbi:MAG: pantoate--beta-alanine ligase [Hyphomonadaceae bacterium]